MLALGVVGTLGCDDGEPPGRPEDLPEVVLWHEVPLTPFEGSYVSLGDLDSDGRVDFLLYRMGPLTTPGRLAALDFDGELLWERGDATLERHEPVEPTDEPPVRAIAFVFDIDEDGEAEVITELWVDEQPMLMILDGATGEIEQQQPSPFDLSVRLPDGYSPWRGHPVGRIAYLAGNDGPPSMVLKYGSSHRIPGHVVALTPELETIWQARTDGHAVGHIPTVADIDGDGRDEIVAGEAAFDHDGDLLWQQPFGAHADMTDVADVHPSPGPEVLMSICSIGPVYCLTPSGDILWQLSQTDVSHGQGLWPGDFIADEPGLEIVVLRSGHRGIFRTVRGVDGATLADFTHRFAAEAAYPDLPRAVRWQESGQLLWVPQDRALVDGRGEVVQLLDPYDEYVVDLLHPGDSKDTLAVQLFVVDLCGDSRDELVLYHPFAGESLLIFSQPGADCATKPYTHQRNAYNMRTYF